MEKSKCEYSEEDIPNLRKNFDENIIPLYKMKEKFLNYLCEIQENIHLKSGYEQISFGYFYFLDDLIMFKKEFINFTYDFDFIKSAYKFLVEEPENLIKKIIGIKIIYDLIDNYKEIEREEKESINEKEIENMKKDIPKLYNNIISKNTGIRLEFHLPENLKELDIKNVLIKKIADIFIFSNFEDYENIHSLINTFAIDSIIIDEDIFNKIKNIINNSKEFYNDFLLTEDDLNNLDNDNSTFQKKVNCLYILATEVLKDPSKIKDFTLLSNISSFLEKIIREKGKEKILSKINGELKMRFSKVIDFFEKKESPFSSNNDCETKSFSFKKEKIKEKKKSDIKKNKNENEIAHFQINIQNQEFIPFEESLKIFDHIEEYLGLNDGPRKINFFDESKIKKYNCFPSEDNNVLYIHKLFHNLKNISDEFRNNLDYRFIGNKKDCLIIFVIRCEDLVHIFYFEKTNNLRNLIKNYFNYDF